MVKINETPAEQLQHDFTEELKDQMKEAALKFGCSVEELKYRVFNNGAVEIARMDAQEIQDRAKQEAQTARVRTVRKNRGVFYDS